MEIKKKCQTLEELVKYLLYTTKSPTGDRIIVAVGIIGDEDITDELSPDLLLKVLKLLD